MTINYQQYLVEVEFERPVNFSAPPSFMFRSVIGKELRYLSCVLKTQRCPDCPLRGKCAYSVIFEIPIDKSNEYLTGRSNATPPFVFNIDYNLRTGLQRMEIVMTLIGKGIEYAPYMILAFVRAGQAGIHKERVQYKLVNVLCNNVQIDLESPRTQEIAPHAFTFDDIGDTAQREFRIKFLSPFRYKKGGNYTMDISFADVLTASARRLDCLSGFYGSGARVKYNPSGAVIKTEGKLYWKDESRYSARQQDKMMLGGVMGEIVVSGAITKQEISFLRGAELFNIGKNISFGLGNISVTEVI